MKSKILILILIIFLSGCGNYRELNNMAIITAVSIDKNDDKYELGYLIANSQKAQTSTKEGEAQTTVYTATGKTITEADEHIGYKSPKKLYYGHINVVIISEEVAKDNFLKIADYLIRHPESRKKFFLMQARGTSAKNIIQIVSPLESFPSQNIATLLKSTKDSEAVIDIVDYNDFINKILEKGNDPILPVLTISGDKEKGVKSENIESTKPEAYIKLDSIAIFREGKFLGYENFKTAQAINIINNNVNELKLNFKYHNDYIGIHFNNIKTKLNIKKNNEIDIDVKGEGFITEVNSKIDLENTKTIKKMEKSLNKQMEKNLKEVINIMQSKYHSDVFGFGNKIYKKYPNKWNKMEKEWNNKYFSKIKTNIKVELKITSTGSLDFTIKEVLS